MKRFIPIALAILLSLSLVGCAAGMKGPTTPAQPDAEEKGELPSVASSGDNKDPELPAEGGKETESAAPVQPLIRYGSFETEKYTVTVSEDGVCHLKFKNPADETIRNKYDTMLGCATEPEWRYDSLAAWQDAMTSGNLSESEEAYIRYFCTEDEDGYVIRSMDDLYESVIPTDLPQKEGIQCFGTYYSVRLGNEQTMGKFSVGDEASYQKYVNENRMAFEDDRFLVAQGEYEGVPYRVFGAAGEQSAILAVYMRYTDGDDTLYIKVQYLLPSLTDFTFSSDMVPYTLDICGDSQGEVFYCGLDNIGTENWIPSLDWLLTFNIMPFVRTADVGLPVEGDIAA